MRSRLLNAWRNRCWRCLGGSAHGADEWLAENPYVLRDLELWSDARKAGE